MAFYQTRINTLHYGTAQPASLLTPGLLLAEPFYSLGVQVRLLLYQTGLLQSHRLTVPVISVGNLTTGGTGKTPVIIALGRYLEAQGYRVAVLSRGYASRLKTGCHEANHPDFGDEPYLIQQHLSQSKVYVGKNRLYTATQAVRHHQPDVILLDDGFQHLRLHRDLNILLVDGSVGFGNGHLLPAGPLREPLSQLRRADVILLTKQVEAEQAARLQAQLQRLGLAQAIPVKPCPFQPTDVLYPATQVGQPLSTLAQQPVILLSGIAQPAGFEAMVLAHTQAYCLQHYIFADHQAYTVQQLQPVWDQLNQQNEAILVTTEKDWVKLQALWPQPLLDRVALFQVTPVMDWASLVSPLLPVKAGAVHG